MPIDLKIDKTMLRLGERLRLTASFKAPAERNQAILSIGVIRPDGTKEYPLYMQRFPLPPLDNTTGALYDSKVMGWHRAFTHVYYYQDTTIIENELTPFQDFLVGPTMGIIVPPPKPPEAPPPEEEKPPVAPPVMKLPSGK
jgi:hypothetical protein